MSCHQKFFPFICFRSLTIARNKAAQRMKQADKTSIQRIPEGKKTTAQAFGARKATILVIRELATHPRKSVTAFVFCFAN